MRFIQGGNKRILMDSRKVSEKTILTQEKIWIQKIEISVGLDEF
jgi:hypothetical protein